MDASRLLRLPSPAASARVAAVACATLAALGALGVQLQLGFYESASTTIRGWTVVSATALGAVVARFAARARSPSAAALRTMSAGAAAGALHGATSIWLLLVWRHYGVVSGNFPVHITGAISAGAVLGFALGAVAAPLARAVARAAACPSHDALERTVCAAAAAVLGVGLTIAPWSSHPFVPFACGAALAVLAGGVARLLARGRFLERAYRGAVPDVRVVPLAGVNVDPGVRPLIRTETAPEALIEAVGAAHPYRRAPGDAPVALVPAPERRGDAAFGHMLRAAAVQVCSVVGILWAAALVVIGLMIPLAFAAFSASRWWID